MRRSFAVLLLFLSTSASAVTIDDIRANLTGLHGAVPVTAKATSTDMRTDGKDKKESRGTSVLEDDGTHIRLIHEKKVLERDEKKRGADYSVGAAEAAELLNFAPSLLKLLEGASVKRTTPTTLAGKPVTLFEIVPVREKSEDDDKIKSYVDNLLVWVDAKGVPVAANRTREIKLRVLLISVEFKDKDELQFARTGDRLMVMKRIKTSSGSGMGQSESGTKTIALTITAS